MGFDLMNNFRRPYFATSIADFWRRWHISLSSWFRDYVYIPLGGNRAGRCRWYANILIVFLASGLWHGADWKFVAWGGIHGLYIVMGRILQPARAKFAAVAHLDRAPALTHAAGTLFTFCLACYAWIFFRANSMTDALYVSTHLFSGWMRPAGISLDSEMVLSIFLIALLLIGQMIAANEDIFARLSRRPVWIRWAAYSALVWCIVILGVFRHKEFIYFTF
jgi:D-alanyl-lipoteichoic acid acyltransferase DltB (MBOAT superfamily)